MMSLTFESAKLCLFRRWMRAVFDAQSSATTAKWLVVERDRLAEQISGSGISYKCEYLSIDVSEKQALEEPFEVFVIGEGKFGKSTLINTLLGAGYAPMDFLPKTWCFNRYIATEKPSDSVKILVKPDFARQRPDLTKWLQTPVKQFRGLLVYQVSAEVAQQIVENEEGLGDSPIMEIEWEVPKRSAILPGIRLVDTQGINQLHRHREHAHYLKWQFARADAVIWLMSAEKINSSATREELIEARRYSKRIILVVNRWDKVDNHERVRRLCEQLYGDCVTDIVYFCALAALVAVQPDIVSQLPGPAKGDLALFCKKHGISNLQKDAQAFRELSGLDNLRNVLVREIAEKVRYIRNRTVYTTLRQQQREFRRIATHAVAEKSHNLAIYRDIKGKIQSTREESLQAIQNRRQQLMADLASLKNRIQVLSWYHFEGNAGKLHQYLQLGHVTSDHPRKLAALEEECNSKVRNMVVAISSANAHYEDSEYDPLGRPAMINDILAMNVASVKVETKVFTPKVSINIGFVHFLLIHVPGAKWLFPEAYKLKCIECVAKIQSELIPQVEQYQMDLLQTLAGLEREINKILDEVKTAADKKFEENFGGEQKVRQEIDLVHRALQRVAVRCAFVTLLLSAMKKVKMPKACQRSQRHIQTTGG